MLRPPLALSVVARNADGVETTWWSGDRVAGNRPQGLTFSTRRGEGFSSATCTLARRADIDHADLNLLDEYTIVGDTGDIAWEGRLDSAPRTIDSAAGHSIAPTLVGWMAHAKDRRFSEVFVDRDLSAWGEADLSRRAALATGGYQPGEFELEPNAAGSPGLTLRAAGVSKPHPEIMYDCGPGLTAARIFIGQVERFALADDASLKFAEPRSRDSTSDPTTEASGTSFRAAPANYSWNPAVTRRVLALVWHWDAGGAALGVGPYGFRFRNVAVYGNHGLTLRGDEPAGLYLSDIIKNIAQRFCPKLNVAGVKDNTTIVPHCAYKDRTFPYDAWLELNGMALWELNVWESKCLTYEAADLTDYDWEVRLSDYGFSTTLNGEDAADLANGIEIEYDDVQTGKRNLLTPDLYPELRDASVENPANQQGYSKWASTTIPFPTTQAIALQIGRGQLAEQNTPKEAGEIRVRGWVRDRAGHWQPAWKVRASDTIAITDFPNSRPRLIGETDYDDTSKELRVAVDSTFKTMEAYTERTLTALKAANLV